MKSDHTYVSRDGAQIGSWSEDEVRTFLRDGSLLKTDFYWKEGMSNWASLERFLPPPPPVPPVRVPISGKTWSTGVLIAGAGMLTVGRLLFPKIGRVPE